MDQQAQANALSGGGVVHETPSQNATAHALQHVRLSEEVVSAHSDSSDAQREVQILHEGRAIEAAMARYAESSDLQDRADADAARIRMEGLIRGRSPEQVARMEQERGLA